MSSGTVGTGSPPGHPDAATPAEANLVIMGRQDYLSVLLRLTGMELYKLRNRAMSAVLGTIGVLSVVLAFLLITFLAVIFLGSSATQENVRSISQLLRLPFSLYVTVWVLFTLGQVLIVILVGAMVGGEYGVGTIRLLLTRGPARGQFLGDHRPGQRPFQRQEGLSAKLAQAERDDRRGSGRGRGGHRVPGY